MPVPTSNQGAESKRWLVPLLVNHETGAIQAYAGNCRVLHVHPRAPLTASSGFPGRCSWPHPAGFGRLSGRRGREIVAGGPRTATVAGSPDLATLIHDRHQIGSLASPGLSTDPPIWIDHRDLLPPQRAGNPRRLHRRRPRQSGTRKGPDRDRTASGEPDRRVDALRRSHEKVFQPPAIERVKDRLENLQEVLHNRTARSARTLRDLLGPIRLELVTPDIGRPFYRAITTLDALALIEPPSGAEGGSNSLQRWRRRELNPRPRSRRRWHLRA